MNRPPLDSTKKHVSFFIPAILTAFLAAIALAGPTAASAADSAKTGSTLSPMVASAHVIKFTPNMRIASLAGRPDSDVVEFADGRRMHVGQLRRLSKWATRARNTPHRPFPAALSAKPAATGRPVVDAGDLVAALKLPDSTTVKLPSGRLATVGQIKLVMPKVEKRLGHPLSAPKRPNLSGPAVKVTAKSDWKHILRQPDNTILEAPDGKRVTVGMIKQALKETGPRRKTSPGKSAPLAPAAPSSVTPR